MDNENGQAPSDIKEVMSANFLEYASYVILDRAIPSVVDGLKPVQRRILYTLFRMDDGRLHKVMNAAGQVMALHPHGDAPIVDAMVNLANKDYLLDKQGNFGNPFTGDPSAAARYIETRLSELAKETMFNPELTELIPSYDGRNKEPVTLPAKIPLLLMQGADGIAVGMSTKILPHNFCELLKAEIAILQDKPFKLTPDFPSGGIIDATDYNKGLGKVKLRAKIDILDTKTLVIREICYGTTTESVIRSIDEAAKKGKIKIDSISDYTSEKVEIEIKMPRGHYAQDLIESLYAFTDCEVSLNSNIVVIKDNLPWETDVNGILHDHTERLVNYLEWELEIERDHLLQKIFEKSLERIFIENRLYKKIEEIKDYEEIHKVIEKSLKPFHKELIRVPTYEDREKLLSIPIRRISRFDLDKNRDEIVAFEDKLDEVENNLKNPVKFSIQYLKDLIKKYGKFFPRRTELQEIEEIDKRAVATKQVKVGFDLAGGFVGTKVNNDGKLECTNYDKILLMYSDGTCKVINIPEKQYVITTGQKLLYVGIADKTTPFSLVYRDPKTHICYGKRFIIKQFILDRVYRTCEEGMVVEFLSDQPHVVGTLHLLPRPKLKIKKVEFDMSKVLIKGLTAKGIRLHPKEVKRVKCKIVEPAMASDD